MTVTKEQIQQWMEEACKHLKIDAPVLNITTGKKGFAKRVRQGEKRWTEIDIPVWVLQQGESFCKYYIVHEVSHLAFNHTKHNAEFREKESTVLLELHGISIKYNKNFPKYLYARGNQAELLWGRSDKRVGAGMAARVRKEIVAVCTI